MLRWISFLSHVSHTVYWKLFIPNGSKPLTLMERCQQKSNNGPLWSGNKFNYDFPLSERCFLSKSKINKNQQITCLGKFSCFCIQGRVSTSNFTMFLVCYQRLPFSEKCSLFFWNRQNKIKIRQYYVVAI